MKIRSLKEVLLYNYRYWFGYAIVFTFGLYFLLWRLTTLNGGLSAEELSTASSHISARGILNLPVSLIHADLQWLSMKLFDINTLAIRLPSVILTIATAFILYSLLKKWFGKPAALISTSIFLSSDWVLYFARSGTNYIEFSFWLVLAILGLTKLLEKQKVGLFFLTMSSIGLLFTPLGIFAAFSLASVLIFNKTFRSRLLENNNAVIIGSGVAILAAFIAFIFSAFNNTQFMKTLIPLNGLSFTAFFKNIFLNTASIAGAIPTANAQFSTTGILFIRFSVVIIALFGIYMLFKTKLNRLNLLVIELFVLLIIIGGLLGDGAGSSLLLIPVIICVTAGMRHLLHRWNQVFPNNPYARLTAYIPLVLLCVITTLMHHAIYFTLWPSQSQTRAIFSNDLTSLQEELNKNTSASSKCIVLSQNQALQSLILASKTKCIPKFDLHNASEGGKIITQEKLDANILPYADPTVRALVDAVEINQVRWLVYTPPSNN
jgi:hypothetical protein